jgi:hypothetical protein
LKFQEPRGALSTSGTRTIVQSDLIGIANPTLIYADARPDTRLVDQSAFVKALFQPGLIIEFLGNCICKYNCKHPSRIGDVNQGASAMRRRIGLELDGPDCWPSSYEIRGGIVAQHNSLFRFRTTARFRSDTNKLPGHPRVRHRHALRDSTPIVATGRVSGSLQLSTDQGPGSRKRRRTAAPSGPDVVSVPSSA